MNLIKKTPQQEPQFSPEELKILLGTPDGQEKGIYQRIEEARLEAYRLLSDFKPERLTLLANVNENLASFLRGIGIIGPNNELLVDQEGLRDNLARIFSYMFIENRDGFNGLKEKVKKYNESLNNINDLSTQIGQLVRGKVEELLGRRLEGLSKEQRNEFLQFVQNTAFDVVVEAIQIGDRNNIDVDNIVARISENIQEKMLELGREKLGIGFKEKLLGSEGRFKEMMGKISEELRTALGKPQEVRINIEQIANHLREMKKNLDGISEVLYKTVLEHGQEFASKAILKGTKTAIEEIGRAGTGNVVENMKTVRDSIEEINKIHKGTELNKPGKTKNVIERLKSFEKRLLNLFISPELQRLIAGLEQSNK